MLMALARCFGGDDSLESQGFDMGWNIVSCAVLSLHVHGWLALIFASSGMGCVIDIGSVLHIHATSKDGAEEESFRYRFQTPGAGEDVCLAVALQSIGEGPAVWAGPILIASQRSKNCPGPGECRLRLKVHEFLDQSESARLHSGLDTYPPTVQICGNMSASFNPAATNGSLHVEIAKFGSKCVDDKLNGRQSC